MSLNRDNSETAPSLSGKLISKELWKTDFIVFACNCFISFQLPLFGTAIIAEQLKFCNILFCLTVSSVVRDQEIQTSQWNFNHMIA